MNAVASGPVAADGRPPARRPLYIAVVTETYPPEVNGVAATVERAVHGLVERDHALQLIRPRQGPLDDGAGSSRLQQVLVRGMRLPMYASLRMGLPATRQLRALWSARRPDIVHVATEGPLGWSAIRAAQRLRLPVVSDFRTNFHAYSRHYGAAWLQRPILAYLRSFHNRGQCTLVPTDPLRAALGSLGFRNLRTLARGVDTARFDPARRSDELRRSWGAGPGTLVALHVGRLAPEKNLHALADAHARMKQARPDLRLVVVGDGPAAADLRRRCPDAVFAGTRTGDDLAAHYASGDLFVFPSLTETYGNVTLEAMASGLAVIAFDYASAAELIRSGHSGLLVAVDAPLQFAHSAAALVRAPGVVRALGARARQAALEQRWERIVEQLESILVGIAGGAAQEPQQPAGWSLGAAAGDG